jgi:superfamily II DNA helicase RecQ
LKIARFAEEFGVLRVLCLTATATNQVAEDICDSFHIDKKEGVFKTPVYRPNLSFRIKVGLVEIAKKQIENPMPTKMMNDDDKVSKKQKPRPRGEYTHNQAKSLPHS